MDGRIFLALASITIVGGVLALAQVTHHLTLASDNAIYMVLAQALASGHGYVMINEPIPSAMNLYPYGYPALLALVLRVTGTTADLLRAVVPLKLVTLSFYVAGIPLAYAIAARRGGPLIGLGVAALVAVNPPTHGLATEILSDVPYAALGWLGIALLEGKGGSWRRLGAAALAFLAAYYIRTAALPLLIIPFLILWYQGRWREAIVLGGFLGLAALPWLARSSAPPSPETPFFARSYIHQVLSQTPYGDKQASLWDLIGRVLYNSWLYATHVVPDTLFPFFSAWSGPVAIPAAALLGAILTAGFLLAIQHGGGVGELAVALTWLSVALFIWILGPRYILLLLPFLFTYLLLAIGEISRRFLPWPILSRLMVVGITAFLLVAALVIDIHRVERSMIQRGQSLQEVYAGSPEWRSYLMALEWLGRNVPRDAVLMGRKPDLLYVLTGHLTVEYPFSTDPMVLQRVIEHQGVDIIVQDGWTWTRSTEIYLVPAMEARGEQYTLLYESPPPPTRLWQVRRDLP